MREEIKKIKRDIKRLNCSVLTISENVSENDSQSSANNGYYALLTDFYFGGSGTETIITEDDVDTWIDVNFNIHPEGTFDFRPQVMQDADNAPFDSSTSFFSLEGLTTKDFGNFRASMSFDPDEDNGELNARLQFERHSGTVPIDPFPIEDIVANMRQGADTVYPVEPFLSFFIGDTIDTNAVGDSGKCKFQVKSTVPGVLAMRALTWYLLSGNVKNPNTPVPPLSIELVTNLNVTQLNAGNDLEVTWDLSTTVGATAHKVYRETVAVEGRVLVATLGSTETSYTESSPLADTEYIFDVQTVSATDETNTIDFTKNAKSITTLEAVPLQAQALYDQLGDTPEWFKPATNDLIQSWVDTGVWDNPNFYAILCVPSLTQENTLIEVKSLTVRAQYFPAIGSNGATFRTFPTNDGYMLTNKAIDTQLQPSTEMTINDNCDWMAIYEDEIDNGTFSYGAFDNPAYLGLISNFGGIARAGSYTFGNVASNSVEVGKAGVYMNNRTGPNYAEIVVNGNVGGVIDTVENGSLPVRTIWINALNRTGPTYRNQSRYAAWGSYGEGLPPATRDILSAAKQTWQNTLKRRKVDKTKQVIWDGNSFNAYWFAAIQRGTQYALGDDRDWHWDSYALSGKELRTMDSEYAATISPLYNGAYTKNIYIISETVNDYTLNNDLNATKATLASLVTKAKADGMEVLVMGGPVRRYQAAFAVPDQATLNLGLDDYERHLIAQAPIQGYTYVAAPTNIWVFRSDYASDTDYNNAVATIYSNSALMEQNFSHPTEDVCINDWAPLIAAAIQSI